MQRYSTEMMDVISAGLDKTATDAANACENRASTMMDVQSAADDTGCTNAGRTWAVQCGLAMAASGAKKVGMKLTDSTLFAGQHGRNYKLLSQIATAGNWARAIQVGIW
ncbi:hypothetical protein ACNKHV_15570 [Shigella flexneri]